MTLRIIAITLLAPPLIFIAAAFLLSLTDIRLRKHTPSWIVLDRNYRFVAEIESPQGEIGYWPAPDTLPRTLVTAVLAAEDRRFRGHIGVDAVSIGRAVVNNYIRKNGFSGASTIAMQTARLQRGGGGGLFSKARDSFAAVWITLIYGRDRVLKQYVSISPYGNRIAGAPCASRRYFRKPVQDLSLAESALLVSIPRAPGRMNMFKPEGFAAARARARFVLGRCVGYGWIDSTEYRQSMAELSEFVIPPKDIRDEAWIHATLRYKSMLHGSDAWIGRERSRGIGGDISGDIDNSAQRTARSAQRTAPGISRGINKGANSGTSNSINSGIKRGANKGINKRINKSTGGGINNGTNKGINEKVNINGSEYHVSDNIKKHGLVVSTIDIDLQRYIQREFADYLDKYRAGDVESGAMVVIDKSSRQVLAYIGSGGYFSFENGMHDYAATKRSTGSLLKPFIFAYGMEELGYTSATVLRDINYDFGEGNRSFIPANSDREYLGPILYKYALANSRNIPAVQVLKSLGVNSVYKRLTDLKLADDDGRGNHYGLGISIGGMYCDLTSISRAYLTLANEGRFGDLAWFKDEAAEYTGNINDGAIDDTHQKRASSRFGKLTIGSAAAEKDDTSENRQPKQVISPEAALMIQRFLSDPLARLPTFPREGFFEYPFAVAVKSGTSDGFRDAWCVAWSKRYLVAAWMGNADNHPTKRVSGYSGPAPIVKKIMLHLHPQERDGQSESAFPAPEGWHPLPICRLTGLRADMFTPYVTSDYFAPGTEPMGTSEVLRVLPVDKRNGMLAGLSCPEKVREFRSFLSLPPEYEPWARAYGLPAAPRLQSPLCQGERMPTDYQVEITWPRSGARFFTDPEMPQDQAFLPVTCTSEPEAESILWFVNGEEHTVTNPPHTLRLPMKAGKYALQAGVAGTPVRSRVVRVEVY